MNRSKTGNNKFLKRYNETAVLDLIRVRKGMSRADISLATGLSPTATGMIVSGLMEKGYIYETGTGESRGGRRPVMLELKPGSFFSAGVDIDTDYVNVILMDITGRIIGEKTEHAMISSNAGATARKIEDLVEEVLKNHGVHTDRLLGIGISVPGMVDSETHRIVLAPNLGWENTDMASLLEGFPRVPVYLENEAMASAICENWIGSCQGVDNFVCINIKSGIGAGIYTGGRLYRGSGGSAGEMGHIVVDENGPLCGCGNYGCLETMASTTRIIEKVRKLVRQGVVSKLNGFQNLEEITINDVIAAARSGDEAARGILTESARYLGIAVSNIVNTLNPSKIVIGKEFVRYADIVMDQVKSIVKCKALKSPASKVEIAASEIGEKTSVIGAAIIPLKVLFGR